MAKRTKKTPSKLDASKPFLVASDFDVRREFVLSHNRPRVAIHRTSPLAEVASQFDKNYTLSSLFTDDVFFDAMASVTGDTTLFIVDLGIEYHCGEPKYIKPYTRLKPLSTQASKVCVIDHFAFYYSPCSIVRPFLYIHGDLLPETLNEFYGVGPYAGNELGKVESFAPRIKAHATICTSPLATHVIRYSPTQEESGQYEALKYQAIMVDRLPKTTILNKLFAFIEKLPSRKSAIDKFTAERISSGEPMPLIIESNDYRKIAKNYERIVERGSSGVAFLSSGTFGCDESALSQTLGAITEHNRLIEIMAGMEAMA